MFSSNQQEVQSSDNLLSLLHLMSYLCSARMVDGVLLLAFQSTGLVSELFNFLLLVFTETQFLLPEGRYESDQSKALKAGWCSYRKGTPHANSFLHCAFLTVWMRATKWQTFVRVIISAIKELFLKVVHDWINYWIMWLYPKSLSTRSFLSFDQNMCPRRIYWFALQQVQKR